MTVNARSVLTTTFHLGTFQIPIRLYKTTNEIGLSGSLFHEGCGGKIRQWKTCEDHPNTEDPATFSGIAIGTRITKLTKDVKSQLLGGNVEFKAIGVHKFSDFAQLSADQSIVAMEPYEIAPEKYFEGPFSTLLDRLRVRRQFLLAQYSMGMRRYGVLLHTGIFVPIRYVEEVRERKFEPVAPHRKFAKLINAELDELDGGDFPELSAGDLLARIQQWFTDISIGQNIVAYEVEKERVNA